MSKLYHETALDYVAAWDAGERCYTYDTSCLGWEFEEPIQVLCVEVLRACTRLDECTIGKFHKAFTLVHRSLAPQMPEISPMQLQHCRWLAWQYMQNGPRALLDQADRDGKQRRVLAIRPPQRPEQQTLQLDQMAEAVKESLGKTVH